MDLLEVQLGGLNLAAIGFNCLCVLPPDASHNSKDSQSNNNNAFAQKLVVGDSKGRVCCFSLKLPNVEVVWSTVLDSAVSCICLGGVAGAKDKIFIATGSTVVGVNRKGKQFFSFDTNLTERISQISVDSNDLFVIAGHISTHYVEAAEKSYYACPAIINNFAVVKQQNDVTTDSTIVLACQDRCLRVLSDSTILFEVGMDCIPTALCVNPFDSSRFLYGTDSGVISQISLASDQNIITDWVSTKGRPVKVIHAAGSKNYIYIARDDGALDICIQRSGRMDVLDTFSSSEIITGVIHGNISASPIAPESIAFTTFSGRVCTLERKISLKLGNLQEQIDLVRSEIDTLEKEITNAKDKLKRAIPKSLDAQAVLPMPQFTLRDSLKYNAADMSYILSVDSDIPLMMLTLHAPFLIDLQPSPDIILLDAENSGMKAIIQSNDSYRAEARLHPIEGQTGIINAIFVIRNNPIISLARQYNIKPLSSYERSVNKLEIGTPLNKLKMTGNFSVPEINVWISNCLPEIPEKLANTSAIEYFFQSPFLDTQLNCELRKGQAEFTSDSLSSLMILRDAVNKEASSRGRQINMDVEVNQEAVKILMKKLYDKLAYQRGLTKNISLLEAIKDLQTQENDLSFLSKDLADLWSNRTRIESEILLQPKALERIMGYFVDIYVHYNLARGKSFKQLTVAQLKHLLSDQRVPTFEDVSKFILDF